MAPYQFIKSKTITLAELEKHFKPIARKDSGTTGLCPVCNSDCNCNPHPSEPWSLVDYCHACNVLIMRFPQDAMSGYSGGTPLIVFAERETTLAPTGK